MGALKSFESPHCAPHTFPEIFNGLLFRSILRMCVQKLKFVALPVPDIIGGILKKFGQSLDTPTLHFLPKFKRAFVRMDPLNISAKFVVRSFTHSWDNRGYFKNMGSRWIRPRSLFSQIFKGHLFAWTLWIYLPSLKFVALPIPEIIGGTQKIGAVPGYAHAPFFCQNFKGLLFGWTLWIYLPNLKFVALSIPEIIGGTQKMRAVPGYAHAPFSPKFLIGVVCMDPVNITAKFEVRNFTRSWDNRGYSKNWGSPCIRPRSIFSENFKGLLFGWTLWIYLPNLKFVALSVHEIVGGTQKIWAVPVYAHAPFSPKFLIDFFRMDPLNISAKLYPFLR